MGNIKSLAKDTLWYGMSTILVRFLNYGLAFLHVRLFHSVDYGVVSSVYAGTAFLNIVFTYGMETGYFRFVQNDKYKNQVYNTSFISLLVTTIFFTILMLLFAQPLAGFMEAEKAQYIKWFAFILCFDTLSVIPFARLRQQGRPRKYALIKVSSIFIIIFVQIFFLWVCPRIEKSHPGFTCFGLYDPAIGIGYVFISNLVASAFTLVMLSKEISSIKWHFNAELWKQMMIYSLPLLIVGFGGMVNETFDRIMLPKFYGGGGEAGQYQNGIYGACYKLSLLITLFIQAFRMGAEPFFFKQADKADAPRTYARVMKFFVLVCCCCFLIIVLFLNAWKALIATKNPEYGEGIYVVPILAFGNVCLGIYYNLSVWYKITNKTMTGAYITIAGAAFTILINWLFIPRFSYWACAWATCLCYVFMMVISYVLGQKNYFVPYAWKKLLAYLVIVLLLFGLHEFIIHFFKSNLIYYTTALLFLSAFMWFILQVERKEFKKLPVVGKFVR